MPVATSADLKNAGGIVGFTDIDAPEPELLKACVHCGMCLSSCPTYRITGQEMSSPRGRLWLMSAVSQGRLSVDDDLFQEQMYQCLNCRACEAVCPSGVQYGPLVGGGTISDRAAAPSSSEAADCAKGDARLDFFRHAEDDRGCTDDLAVSIHWPAKSRAKDWRPSIARIVRYGKDGAGLPWQAAQTWQRKRGARASRSVRPHFSMAALWARLSEIPIAPRAG